MGKLWRWWCTHYWRPRVWWLKFRAPHAREYAKLHVMAHGRKSGLSSPNCWYCKDRAMGGSTKVRYDR